MKTMYIDLDGTIVDVSDRLFSLHKDLLTNQGIKKIMPKTKYIRLKRLKTAESKIVQHLLDKKETADYTRKRLFLIESMQYLKLDKPFPWSKSALNRLSKKYRLVLVTRRKSKKNAMNELSLLGFNKFFDKIIVAGSYNISKAKLILQDSNFKKQDSIIVGDTEEEIRTGRNLNIRTIAVSSGCRTKSILKKFNPACIKDNISQIR